MPSLRWASVRSGRRRTWIRRRVAAGEQVGEARLGLLVARSGIEYDLGHEVRVVDARDAQQAVAQAQPEQLLLELRLGQLARLVAQAPLDRGRVAAALRGVLGLLGQHVGLALVGLQALLESAGDLGGGEVEEGAGAEDHAGRLGAGQLPADGRQLLQALGRYVARQAALEPDEAAEVGGEDDLLQRPLGHDDDRVVSEVALEVLGGREGVRAAVDERLGVHGGLEPQREGGAAQRQHGHDREGQPRPAGGRARYSGEVEPAREAPEDESPPHQAELRRRLRALTPVGEPYRRCP